MLISCWNEYVGIHARTVHNFKDEISGSHVGEYEENNLPGYSAV
jgi:hypothetical protein